MWMTVVYGAAAGAIMGLFLALIKYGRKPASYITAQPQPRLRFRVHGTVEEVYAALQPGLPGAPYTLELTENDPPRYIFADTKKPAEPSHFYAVYLKDHEPGEVMVEVSPVSRMGLHRRVPDKFLYRFETELKQALQPRLLAD